MSNKFVEVSKINKLSTFSKFEKQYDDLIFYADGLPDSVLKAISDEPQAGPFKTVILDGWYIALLDTPHITLTPLEPSTSTTDIALTNTDVAEIITGAYMALEDDYEDILAFAEAVNNQPMSTIISLPDNKVDLRSHTLSPKEKDIVQILLDKNAPINDLPLTIIQKILGD